MAQVEEAVSESGDVGPEVPTYNTVKNDGCHQSK